MADDAFQNDGWTSRDTADEAWTASETTDEDRASYNSDTPDPEPAAEPPEPFDEAEAVAPFVPFVRASDLLAEAPEPRDWLVEHWLPAAQAVEIRGDGKTGKSTLALQLAVATVSGRAWVGKKVKHGPAVVVVAEDDRAEVARRLRNIAAYEGLEAEDLADLQVWPLAAEEDPALAVPEGSMLKPTPRWDTLVAKVEEIRPAMVVLDSRADMFGGNEIERAQVRRFVGMLRGLAIRTGACIVTLAHPSQAGIAAKNGSSGSTHWTNATRAALLLAKPSDTDNQPADPDARVLTNLGGNYQGAGEALALRWTPGGFVVAEDQPGGKRATLAKARAEVERVFLQLLDAFEAQGRIVSDSHGRNFAPNLFSRDPRAQGIGKRGFEDAMMRLFAAGKIRMVEDGKGSHARRKLVRVGA